MNLVPFGASELQSLYDSPTCSQWQRFLNYFMSDSFPWMRSRENHKGHIAHNKARKATIRSWYILCGIFPCKCGECKNLRLTSKALSSDRDTTNSNMKFQNLNKLVHPPVYSQPFRNKLSIYHGFTIFCCNRKPYRSICQKWKPIAKRPATRVHESSGRIWHESTLWKAFGCYRVDSKWLKRGKDLMPRQKSTVPLHVPLYAKNNFKPLFWLVFAKSASLSNLERSAGENSIIRKPIFIPPFLITLIPGKRLQYSPWSP